MSGFARELPKIVQQYKGDGRFTCWAAALESWLSVTPQSPASWFIKTQDDALAEYKVFTDGGSLEVKWGSDCQVSYMDPWYAAYKKDEPLNYFQQANEAVAGWFEYTA